MRKTCLLAIFLALCISFYTLSGAYATISTLITPPNSSEKPSQITNEYNAPKTSQPNLRVYGDPIQDPRPKMRRPPVPI